MPKKIGEDLKGKIDRMAINRALTVLCRQDLDVISWKTIESGSLEKAPQAKSWL